MRVRKSAEFRDEPSTLPATYQVGYKKPPVAHRFAKGRSGNPGGRPKGARNKVPKGQGLEFCSQLANKLLLEEAYRTIAVREGEKVVELSVMHGSGHHLVSRTIEAWPITYHSARLLTMSVDVLEPLKEAAIVRFRVDQPLGPSEPNFAENLVFNLNLLREATGDVRIYPAT